MEATSNIAALLAREIPGFSIDEAGRSFVELGLDSFALIELRIAIEYAVGAPIPDAVWIELETPAQIMARFCVAPTVAPPKNPAASLRRSYMLNMPQMALGGLSESWLFKELGDAHWSLITGGLGAPSRALHDGCGDRLYATFTRIRVEASAPLSRFEENEHLELEGCIRRFGAGMFFSEFALAGTAKMIRGSVMSSFTKRGSPTSNSSLLKGQPAIPAACPIPALAEMPEFGLGYRKRRSALPEPALFEMEYNIIPYYDINGVGLLYFAAYPTISDICELKYMGRANEWALEASTISRDVFYFANSDVSDRLVWRVHAKDKAADGVTIESSISRVSDGVLMAYLVTRKAITHD